MKMRSAPMAILLTPRPYHGEPTVQCILLVVRSAAGDVIIAKTDWSMARRRAELSEAWNNSAADVESAGT